MIVYSTQGVTVMKRLTSKDRDEKQTIVIDPGHGGFDPGKIGVNDALEKEINLAISFKVKTLLEQVGYQVVLTRTTDKGLYEETDRKKKSADLKNRVTLINETKPVIAISIHQNSFPQASSKGAQVFYHGKSADGKVLADTLQDAIKEVINDGNHRIAKANESYYMLKNTTCPIVIVECGFLSNPTEADLLLKEEYQDKMAWAIQVGILRYLHQKE